MRAKRRESAHYIEDSHLRRGGAWIVCHCGAIVRGTIAKIDSRYSAIRGPLNTTIELAWQQHRHDMGLLESYGDMDAALSKRKEIA
jgi:hypothetical protein